MCIQVTYVATITQECRRLNFAMARVNGRLAAQQLQWRLDVLCCYCACGLPECHRACFSSNVHWKCWVMPVCNYSFLRFPFYNFSISLAVWDTSNSYASTR